MPARKLPSRQSLTAVAVSNRVAERREQRRMERRKPPERAPPSPLSLAAGETHAHALDEATSPKERAVAAGNTLAARRVAAAVARRSAATPEPRTTGHPVEIRADEVGTRLATWKATRNPNEGVPTQDAEEGEGGGGPPWGDIPKSPVVIRAEAVVAAATRQRERRSGLYVAPIDPIAHHDTP